MLGSFLLEAGVQGHQPDGAGPYAGVDPTGRQAGVGLEESVEESLAAKLVVDGWPVADAVLADPTFGLDVWAVKHVGQSSVDTPDDPAAVGGAPSVTFPWFFHCVVVVALLGALENPAWLGSLRDA